MAKRKKGCFIVFEGIDGSGKTTQIRRLATRLRGENKSYYLTREPTGGHLGKLLRRYLSGELQTDERAIAALFAADRIDHLTNKANGIARKIEDGINVISDRYYLSSLAYQSASMPLEWVEALNAQSAEILKPTCHIFIDIKVETALSRVLKGRETIEIYETKEKLEKIKEQYLTVIEHLKDREDIVVIDGNQGAEAVAESIWREVVGRLDAE